MPRISQEDYRQRKGNILAAAKAAFLEKGIHISVDEVCAAAGVSKGAFYGYFRSKDQLFEALAQDHGALLAENDPVDDRAALLRMLEARASIDAAGFAQVELETLAYALRHPGLRGVFTDNIDLLRQRLETALRAMPGRDEARTTRDAAILQLAVQGAFLSMAMKGADAADDARTALEDLLALIEGEERPRAMRVEPGQ